MERTVYLGNIENALNLIRQVERIDASVKLVCGTKKVDAKSILGVFSMELDKPMTLEISGTEPGLKLVDMAIQNYIME